MTSSTDSATEGAGLQFDRAEQQDGSGGGERSPLVCAKCRRAIETEYFQVGTAVACGECKAAVVRELEGAAAQGRRASGLARAVLFGLGAAIAGAIVYYAVIAITEWELAIVALLCGYMVGWAVRRGSRGVGGRRYQVTAMLLTYLSVGMAYTPVAFKGVLQAQQKGGASALAPAAPVASGKAPAATPAPPAAVTPAAATPTVTPAASGPSGAAAVAANPAAAAQATPKRQGRLAGPVPWGALILALLVALVFSLVLPIAVVIGTLPSGILSAVIIGVGMRQAWKMTAGLAVPVSGPYRVGTGPA